MEPSVFTLLTYGYEFISQFAPFFIVLMLFWRNHGKYTSPSAKGHHALLIAFAFYIIAVFHVTGAGTIYDAMASQFEDLQSRVNLIPFSNKINVRGYLLNIVMFIPFGLLVPLIWKDMRKCSHMILAGLAFSLLIELSQLLCQRGTDVDDLIMNTAGAVIGFLLYKVWDNVTKSKYQINSTNPLELPVYIFILYLGRCLLFNHLGFIHLVYG